MMIIVDYVSDFFEFLGNWFVFWNKVLDCEWIRENLCVLCYVYGKNWFVNNENLGCGGVMECMELFWVLI